MMLSSVLSGLLFGVGGAVVLWLGGHNAAQVMAAYSAAGMVGTIGFALLFCGMSSLIPGQQQ
jgi:hypothetical protein